MSHINSIISFFCNFDHSSCSFWWKHYPMFYKCVLLYSSINITSRDMTSFLQIISKKKKQNNSQAFMIGSCMSVHQHNLHLYLSTLILHTWILLTIFMNQYHTHMMLMALYVWLVNFNTSHQLCSWPALFKVLFMQPTITLQKLKLSNKLYVP